MTCQICPATPNDGPLYRINAKGVPGIWRCSQHLGDHKVDPIVRDVAEIAHEAGNATKG